MSFEPMEPLPDPCRSDSGAGNETRSPTPRHGAGRVAHGANRSPCLRHNQVKSALVGSAGYPRIVSG